MNRAILDDGRNVIVDTAKRQVSIHRGTPVPTGYVNVLLDGSWQTVKASRLKVLSYGNPFGELNEK